MSADSHSVKEAVKVYKALGEPTRLRIVQLLCKHKELSCTESGVMRSGRLLWDSAPR